MEELITEITELVLKGRNTELVDMAFHLSGKDPMVRIFADKPGGITVGDCADITRELSANFMVEDAIPDGILIEVSSPGLDRPLKTRRDFERNLDRALDVQVLRDGGTVEAAGRLAEVRAESIVLEDKQGRTEIRLDAIGTAKQHIPF